jgi:RND family efflux transporter MFP subunit
MKSLFVLCRLLMLAAPLCAADLVKPVPAAASPSAAAAPVASPSAPLPEEPNPASQIRAKLSPVRYAFLSAEVAAKVEKLPFGEGARFRQGDKLIIFDAAVHRAQAEKARVLHASTVRVAEAYARLSEQGSVGRLELLAAQSRAAEAKADKELAEVMLSKCVIVAPFGGRVGELRVREQQYVQSGQPLVEVIDDSSLELEFIANSSALAWLRVGQKFAIKVDETGRSYDATLTRIGAKVDPVSQTIKLAASIAPGHKELLAGMSGTIDLSAPRR